MQDFVSPNAFDTARVKELREEKQRCARRFGEAKRAGQEVELLKAEMRKITEELDTLLEQLQSAQRTSQELPRNPTVAGQEIPLRSAYRVPNVPLPPGVSLHAATEPDDLEWDEYVLGHPAASPYHFSCWRRLVVTVMRHVDISLMARSHEGRIVGVLPLIYMRSVLFGRFAVSMPYFNYGGPLADSASIEEALLNAAAQVAERRGARHLEIREMCSRADWMSRGHKVSMLRRLPSSGEELDAQLGSKLRAQVQRARRENPEMLIGGAERLDDFYRVFAENMRDLGTPVYTKRLFLEVLRAWPARSHIAVMRLKGRPVAAGLLLGYGDVLEIPWASALRKVNQFGMNMLLYREMLGFAIERKYGWFDFGRSTEGAGTYRFKKQWGAFEVRHQWHYWLREASEVPNLNPENDRLQLLIQIWRRLPVAFANAIGPGIVRCIP